jgi:hypothetical protein
LKGRRTPVCRRDPSTWRNQVAKGSEAVVARVRIGLGVISALGMIGMLAGCRQTASLSMQEVVVVFKTDATAADHARVYDECKTLPGVSPEPLVTDSKYSATLANNVRYRVDHATNYQLQQLYNCLGKDPSVAGYKPPVDQGQ